MKLIVIGVSGITGGGKTTLASTLYQFLSDQQNAQTFDGFHINKVILIHQDKYFYARDSPHHEWIPEINFINREQLSAMDMNKFADDVRDTVQELQNDNNSPVIQYSNGTKADGHRTNINILIIEGFLIYNDERINQYFGLRFQLHLSYDVGLERRLKRTFKHVNPKPVWYWEHYIWPSYHNYLEKVPNKSELIYLNGEQPVDDVLFQAFDAISIFIKRQKTM